MTRRKPTAAARAKPPSPAPAQPAAQIISFSEVRLARRLGTYREKLDKVLRTNKRAIGRLYASGTLFTRVGTRAGRDLLLAHEHLLRVVGLVERLSDTGDVPAPRKSSEVDAIFDELDTLLERTTQLTEHTAAMIDELKREE